MTVPVLLKPKAKPLHAREIVVAPRMPKLNPGNYTGNPFTAEGDVVLDCESRDHEGVQCGWHAMGPRADVKRAYDEHRKQYHQEAIGVVLLNQPRQ